MFLFTLMSTHPDPIAELAEARARHLAQTREAQSIILSCMRAAAVEQPAPEPNTPKPRQPGHVLDVTRLSRALHQAMAFEARTLTGDRPRRPWQAPIGLAAPTRPPGPVPNPIQSPLAQVHPLPEIADAPEALPPTPIKPAKPLHRLTARHAIYNDPENDLESDLENDLENDQNEFLSPHYPPIHLPLHHPLLL